MTTIRSGLQLQVPVQSIIIFVHKPNAHSLILVYQYNQASASSITKIIFPTKLYKILSSFLSSSQRGAGVARACEWRFVDLHEIARVGKRLGDTATDKYTRFQRLPH